MADKKFKGPDGAISGAQYEADYQSAEKFDTVKVGALGVYYKEGLKVRLMPYDALERVFIRIQEVNGRMCCGNTIFAYYRLVFVRGGKEIGDTISENEKAMDDALALIHVKAPGLAIGVAQREEVPAEACSCEQK